MLSAKKWLLSAAVVMASGGEVRPVAVLMASGGAVRPVAVLMTLAGERDRLRAGAVRCEP
ncbi:hypothetical protein AAFP35_23590 [Gordonia sp. CPCC 206044]|uniref:hypothetical protein n=1 Tax=Gordonia sp. CPCC 206044 TaxID=3140793 RepID=UPI003AF3BC3E